LQGLCWHPINRSDQISMRGEEHSAKLSSTFAVLVVLLVERS